ncbi:MAG: PucR family transcriptional regulator [Candidatus Dormibacteria bacterium]
MSTSLITVKDVWRGSLPPATELLGGGEGLDRRVEWATALRTRPPAFDAIKGGELAFVPVKSIRLLDDRLDLAQVMTSLAEKGGVAVAVVGDVSPQSLEVAERLSLPLLRLPASVHVADVQQTTVRFILEQRTLLHEREQTLHRRLMELALSGAGPAAIVDEVSRAVGAVAAWQDEDGSLRHLTDADEVLGRCLAADMTEVRGWSSRVALTAADPPVREFSLLQLSDRKRLVSPIPVRDDIGGYLSIVGPQAHLGHLVRLACARAASACAIELDRERAVLKARDDLEGEFLDSLLTGTFSSEEAVQERGRRLGFDLGGHVTVLAARDDSAIGQPWEEAALHAARGWVRRRASAALVTLHQGAVCAIIPSPADGHGMVGRLAHDLRLECAQAAGRPGLSVGVGRPKPGVTGVRASHREAEQALTLGHRLFGGGRVLDFADLGLHRLLFALTQHAELLEFHGDNVGGLEAYDERTGGALMKTLDAYFACHGSPTEMAERLHLHRNTVLYRLGRIEEIGRLSLNDPATRLNLHLCLRVGEVIQAAGRP